MQVNLLRSNFELFVKREVHIQSSILIQPKVCGLMWSLFLNRHQYLIEWCLAMFAVKDSHQKKHVLSWDWTDTYQVNTSGSICVITSH